MKPEREGWDGRGRFTRTDCSPAYAKNPGYEEAQSRLKDELEAQVFSESLSYSESLTEAEAMLSLQPTYTKALTRAIGRRLSPAGLELLLAYPQASLSQLEASLLYQPEVIGYAASDPWGW